jgi:hypothetical protein
MAYKRRAGDWSDFMRVLGLIAGVAMAAIGATQTLAACRDDLIKADQEFSVTRSALQAAASAEAPARCAAYRHHVAALTQVRKVFARCDTSADKTKNAAQTNTALVAFTRQMHESCKK